MSEASLLTISSYNLRGGLSDSKRARRIADTIVEQWSDIVILPDAWHTDSPQSQHSNRDLLVPASYFKDKDYFLIDAAYDEPRPDDDFATYHFAILVKRSLAHRIDLIKLSPEGRTRSSFKITTDMGNKALHTHGVYLTNLSAHDRKQQIETIQESLNDGEPTLIIGDLNDIPRDRLIARVVRSSLFRTTLGKVSIANNVFPRIADMGEGVVHEKLNQLGFKSVLIEPTVPSLWPVFPLDDILEHNFSENGIDISGTVGEHSPLSDHRPIRAVISRTK